MIQRAVLSQVVYIEYVHFYWKHFGERVTDDREDTLSNLENKEMLISQMIQIFKYEVTDTISTDDDADLLIIQIVTKNRIINLIIVGQNIDFLVLLIALAPENKDTQILDSERKYRGKKLQFSRYIV